MTKEEKNLLLKDLCARLPYGIILYRISDKSTHKFIYSDITENIDQFSHFLEYSGTDDIKPYLRPMLSMTEEEATEYANCGNIIGISVDGGYLIPNPESINWLNKNHFDYLGLIEKGLALEAPENMYNI